MAENVTIARPYAEAAFKVAQANQSLAAWADVLAAMAAVASDPQMQACADNPQVPRRELATLFLNVLGDKLNPEQKNFAHLLIDNERLDVLPEIHQLFIGLKNGQEGTKKAEISSAFPIDAEVLKNLVAELERRFSCKIEASVTLNPELIGGVRIAVGDQVIDASVRGKLAAMRAALLN